MNKQFVKYEIANQLKKIGFVDPCVAWWCDENTLILNESNELENNNCPCPVTKEECGFDYTNSCSAPLYQQVIDWLQEKHNIYIEVHIDRTTDPKFCYTLYKYSHFGNWEVISTQENWGLTMDPYLNLECAIEESLNYIKEQKPNLF